LFKAVTDAGEGFTPSRRAAPIIFMRCGCSALNDNQGETCIMG